MPNHEISISYGYLIMTLVVTYFYGFILPAGYIITLFGLCLYYWVQKVILVQ